MIVFDQVSAHVQDAAREARPAAASPQPKAAATAAPSVAAEARLHADLLHLERRKARLRAT